MRVYQAIFCVLSALLLMLTISLLNCAKEAEEDTAEDYETVSIIVKEDQLYNFTLGEEIGAVQFYKKTGPAGSRVTAIVFLETLTRFPDQRINVSLELLNQDASREPWETIEWIQDTNEETVEFVVPVVETIPSILNFRLKVYEYIYSDEQAQTLDDDTADDDTAPDDDTTLDDDAADDDAVSDDDTAVGDDDTAPTPDKTFEAEAVYLFIVDSGQPGAGD